MTEDIDIDNCYFNSRMSQESRVDLAVCCLCGGAPVALVKREIVRCCKISKRMAEYIIYDALAMLEGSHYPVRALKLKSLAWYRAQLLERSLPAKYKFAARKHLDRALGLYDEDLNSIEIEKMNSTS